MTQAFVADLKQKKIRRFSQFLTLSIHKLVVKNNKRMK